MAVNINASNSAGVQITSDTSGVIQFQSSGANTVQITSSGAINVPSTLQFQSNGANTVQIASNAALLTTGGGTLIPPATGVVTIPDGTGTVAVANVSSNLVLGTVKNASGTPILFTGIPSWVKRVTVLLQGVSTNGTSVPLIQVGAGSVTASGYSGLAQGFNASATTGFNSTAGFPLINTALASATNAFSGHLVLTNITGNTWVASGTVGSTASSISAMLAGSIALSGTLDRVNITTVNGTDAFDAGSINIMWE